MTHLLSGGELQNQNAWWRTRWRDAKPLNPFRALLSKSTTSCGWVATVPDITKSLLVNDLDWLTWWTNIKTRGLFIYFAKKLDLVQKSGISAKILDFSRPRTKNLDFGGRPLCTPWNPGFLPSGFAKNLDFMQKIGIWCKKAGFHRCLKSHFFAIPTARGRPWWNPWKITL